MENNIHLFDLYIDDLLSPGAKAEFENRLKSDQKFRQDFRIYLFTLQGIIKEAEQDDIEFGAAMTNISDAAFGEAIRRQRVNPFLADDLPPVDNEEVVEVTSCDMDMSGWEEDESRPIEVASFNNEDKPIRDSKPYRSNKNLFAWISSIAALFIIGIFSIIAVMRNGDNKVDDVIAFYNETTIARGGDSLPSLDDLSADQRDSVITTYREIFNNPQSSLQESEHAGFVLAIVYLKNHDRKASRKILEDMTVRFADDKLVAERCREILHLLD